MILQRVLFPSENRPKELYMRDKGEWVSFDTFFNSFSIEKWEKYTNLKNLLIKVNLKNYDETFNIKVYNKKLVKNKIEIIEIKTIRKEHNVYEICNLGKIKKGIIYFEIEQKYLNKISKIDYISENVHNINQNKVNLALIICTYKREAYVQKFLDSFSRIIKKNFIKDRMKVYIVDNAKTLSLLQTPENVKIFKNKNYGGAGGFTRGIIEIQKYNQKNEEKISHILLMDDDILFDFRVLERMKSFLELKKEEFNNYFIAGSMCSLDHPEIQYESYASWRGRFFTPFKHNVNLSDVYKVLMNEKEEKYANGTAGWWFSCFSVDIIGKNNYPFPCFFRGDDVEFTIRNESKIINLNGLNVWHEPFYKKYSIVSENYYLLRNMLVVNALYTKMGYKDNLRYLTSKFVRSIMYLNYNSAKLVIRALKDFSKGVSFFEETNPEELNGELMKLNPKMDFIWNLIEEYKLEDIYHQIQVKNDRNKLFKILRLLSFNGYLIPKVFYKEFGIAQLGFAARPINFFKTKRVLNYDIFSQKAYFSEISKIKALKLVFEYAKECIKYYFNFNKINKNYQEHFYKIQNIDFWEKYLELEKDGK